MNIKLQSRVYHTGDPKKTSGRVIGLSHVRDRYLVMWSEGSQRWQGTHSRMVLRRIS